MQDHRAAGRAPPPPPLLLLLQLLLLSRAAALHPDELFPYGEAHGDQRLREGDDQSSAAVQLAVPLRFYDAQFRSLYVGTNGIISTQDFPKETQYVDDDLPTDFPAIAPFLADIDTSGGRGRVLYRQDSSPAVLGLAARYVRAGFPHAAASFTPTHAFVATWDQVGAYEEVGRGAAPSEELNTFQAVLASDESDAYALFLYPANGLQFFGTRPKESYNVQLQLPARVGFCRGEADDLKREGKYLSLTRTEQSVKNLYQLSNVGIPGLWAFHIGSASPLDNVRPAAVGGALSAAHSSAPLKHPFSHAAALKADHPEDSLDYYDENEEEVEYPPAEAEAATVDIAFHSSADSGPEAGGLSPPDSDLASPLPPPASSEQPSHPHSESTAGEPPSKQEAQLQEVPSPEWRPGAQPLGQIGAGSVIVPAVDGDPVAPAQEAPTRHPDDAGARYSVPSLSGGGRYVAGVEEDITPNAKVFTYNAAPKETCERNHGQCSAHAFCTDYTTGFCCHCQSSFFGDGKHCLPEGAPHRVNGKVSGHLRVGHTPVHFTDVDLHAYIVGNDGRAYTAISHIPPPAAQALLPLTPLGGLFGWLFALEKLGSENGFSLTGATFVQDTEVTFYPGEERLRIIQTAEGLDPENYLSMKINIQGQVPYVPANSIAHLAPYKEIYHHSDSGVTSTSSRDYYLTFGTVNQTGSYRIHQNITYQGCRHAPSHRAVPAAQQLTVDRVFALYNEEEGVLRFAVTSQIGPVEVTAPPPNPCEDGTHTCAPAEQARCIPHGDGTFSCACLPGYAGNGHQCSDVDECSEKSCHPAATCHNTPGSFSCRCQPGYLGDGFTCTPGPTKRPRTMCERWKESLLEHYGGTTRDDQYVPQCDDLGRFVPLQCHGKSDFCWCVDKDGREVVGTRTQPGVTPTCLPEAVPPPIGAMPRPEDPPPLEGSFLVYAQRERLGQLPLKGTQLLKKQDQTLRSMRGSIIVGLDYDCRERKVYWTDVAERVIGRIGAQPGAEPEVIISSGLLRPEGLAVDFIHRTMYWTDSGLNQIVRSNLDGSEKTVLFYVDLVNPRAITVDPVGGNLYWTDWNRDSPKIETSSLAGTGRRILIGKDLGLPNGLNFDPVTERLCWVDAGTRKLECTLRDGTGRQVIHSNLNHPFSVISYIDHFYYTDWRKDGIIAVDAYAGEVTDVHLPKQRDHLYGITAVFPYCPTGAK